MMMLNKVNKTIRFPNILTRSALLTIYKTFIRPFFDYGDIIYGQSCNCYTILQKKKYMKKQVWSPLNYVVVPENYLVFTNSSILNTLMISSN